MKKNLLRAILKLCGFLIIANLPFLTISQLIGIDTFIDSFNHPGSYLYIKNKDVTSMNPATGYIIIEKPTDQASTIREGDSILCHTIKNTLQQRIVSQIYTKDGITTYYTTSYNESIDAPLYESQIIGKIIGTSEDNIWYELCLQAWEISIEKLNILIFFAE
ncbi:MAG TPA: hypothetical protein HA258_03800 [Thermoplasmata archaeon]|nr:hypothetical protein [Thermoplasmata archaeon]